MSDTNRVLPLFFSLDIERLKSDLEICLNGEWRAHFNTRDYSGNWSSISLRSPSGNETDILPVQSETGYRDTPLLEKCIYFREVLNLFECEIEAVRLLKLAPGAEIKTHRDAQTGYQYGFFRLHVPIMTNENVWFEVDGQPLQMKESECWYADFTLPHAAKNEGDADRIHLVIDCRRNVWTDKLFRSAGYDFNAENTSSETNAMIIEQLEGLNTPAARELIMEISGSIKG
ncbi:MAG: aspartyl/asparaginyl beta-hydroxylase domain-containing protein [Pyrinomonadaceae bacterium]